LDFSRQNALYREATAELGAAIQRVARAYEADREKQRDLLQEIHLELWRSFGTFDGRCSLRTWTYRIAHNVGATHIIRSRRTSAQLVDLGTLEASKLRENWGMDDDRRLSAAMLLDLIYRLKPLDRQVILLYLEGEAAADIAQTTGLSAGNVATKIHRIKKLLKQQYAAVIVMSSLALDFLYNVWSGDKPWIRFGQAWAFGLLAYVLGTELEYGVGRKGISETCLRFLERQHEERARGYLRIRHRLWLLIPSIVASWLGGGPLIVARARGLGPQGFSDFAPDPGHLSL
jgi:RNA polymerase sigma-70 factor (ECF subfamily)